MRRGPLRRGGVDIDILADINPKTQEILFKGTTVKPNQTISFKVDGKETPITSDTKGNFTVLADKNTISELTISKNQANLKSIDFSNTDMSMMNSLSEMFYNCTALEDINFGNFDASNVYYTDSMFYNCSSLVGINMRNFKTISLDSMSYMFYGCTSLKSIDLSNCNLLYVTDTTNMFANCKNLKIIYIDDNSKDKLMSQLYIDIPYKELYYTGSYIAIGSSDVPPASL